MNNSSKLLKGMSHEMRTYMNSIVGFSFLIDADAKQEGTDLTYSNRILNSCTQLLWLFDNFLDSAMIDKGNSEVNLVACKLSSILDGIIPKFDEILNQDKSKDITLIKENIVHDSTEVFIDSAKVSRSIECLIQNAINNMISGSINIGYYFNEKKVTFYILDTQQDCEKSREFLYTNDLDKSLTKFFDARTAIDVILAKKLIFLLGGTISIVCNNITGTAVYLTIPIKVIEKVPGSNKRNVNIEGSEIEVLDYKCKV